MSGDVRPGLKLAHALAHQIAADQSGNEKGTAYYRGINHVVDAIERVLSEADRDCLAALSRSQPAASGVELIAAERQRQTSVEGWTPEHDNAHGDHELLMAAYSYIQKAWSGPGVEMLLPPSVWPWERAWWKPSADPVRNLVKAGALIAAEIDRLQRTESASDRAALSRSPVERTLEGRIERMLEAAADHHCYQTLKFIADGQFDPPLKDATAPAVRSGSAEKDKA